MYDFADISLAEVINASEFVVLLLFQLLWIRPYLMSSLRQRKEALETMCWNLMVTRVKTTGENHVLTTMHI